MPFYVVLCTSIDPTDLFICLGFFPRIILYMRMPFYAISCIFFEEMSCHFMNNYAQQCHISATFYFFGDVLCHFMHIFLNQISHTKNVLFNAVLCHLMPVPQLFFLGMCRFMPIYVQNSKVF